ncbi:Myb-like DNA-binding domain containing protein [Trichomonas vaginalis G3]|uniref:Myb-like DNA-binding domain containing protein n=1 Tax=Trichomonas vaginalis (strain ATCC PRA-98 / G3) TaxID=412133 RepID=A2FVW9_TRIV3|nr:chromatin remodeling [Trichomonas vaginalis G3]EAX90954.1 Myb-like DNA-binding domain containing protein [Trichomonas vaginalis G3]KAI5548656.1 chromatin remodeling [Trichomonas vaginalis G3]|eukprot:XP_001303884.1 Myb-like DNA-binding domain containing protein [Trichomonas vaginalis G3]
MLEVEQFDSAVNVFDLCRRPLKICNINQTPIFKPTSTRIPCIKAIHDVRKSCTEAAWEQQIAEPIEENATVDGNIKENVFSDHFNRDFEDLQLPTPENRPVPILHAEESYIRTRPHWHTDVPTMNMHYQKKINIKDVSDPLLTIPLPKCDVCDNQLEYPFFANPKYNICKKCYSEAKLSPFTSTKDLFLIKEPQYNDGNWTLAETNKLLTIIEEIGDDWQTVAKEMKNRTPAECCLHFLRLPIMDQYYNDDVRVVEASDDVQQAYLPFLMAPHPIASFVEFIHIYNTKLGSAVAESSQQIIESLLKANSSMIPFTQIPDILTKIVKATSHHAGILANEEADTMIDLLTEVDHKMNNLVFEQFKEILTKLKNIDQRASSLGFSLPMEKQNE